MTNVPAARWPEFPSGSIDWEKAFEDPANGLIALIRRAQSATALRECMIVIARQLYRRRDDDPSEIERFVGQLKTLIPDQVSPKQFARIVDAMVDILRRIKTDRIRKVVEFEAARVVPQLPEPPAGEPSPFADLNLKPEERRSKSKHARLSDLAEETIARRWTRPALIASGIAAALVMAAIGIQSYRAGEPQREAQRKSSELVAQMQAVAKGKVVGTHVYGGAIRADKVANYPAVVVEGLPPQSCASAGWVFANKGNVMVNGVMPNKASLAALNALCGGTPDGATLIWIPRGDARAKDADKK
jgi:hypothetical protein